ncbi:MAG: ribosome recycling factor [Elusimicrobiota bacterium]|nr:ribosome recycling factor [Endomicrobiia bacterium]MCX7910585.1 ribosome recycling factor [Endomicrobiia bacterium]MDW8164952.1 ribosome recycling factor [Elusimicrobiota bacterium]
MIKELFVKTEELMKKTTEKCKTEFLSIRTGRASISLVENIEVECYNSKMKLNQISNINIIDGKIIEIKPWDSNNLVNIEKAILNSPLGLTPINDGKVIKITVPALTDERRQELVRQVNKLAEDFRIAIRNERRSAIEQLRQLKKDKKISEDEERHAEQQIQKITETYIGKIDELLKQKVKEIMES